MAKVDVGYGDLFHETVHVMTSGGLLLAAQDEQGKPNAMAIGWGTLGSVWGKPLLLVLVRPSRCTYDLIEQTGDFTVNVPPAELAQAVQHCGSVSGRAHDKLPECGLTTAPAREVNAPIIEQCVIHYECRVVHKNDVVPSELVRNIQEGSYANGDYHRIYWGQILATYADLEAAKRLLTG